VISPIFTRDNLPCGVRQNFSRARTSELMTIGIARINHTLKDSTLAFTSRVSYCSSNMSRYAVIAMISDQTQFWSSGAVEQVEAVSHSVKRAVVFGAFDIAGQPVDISATPLKAYQFPRHRSNNPGVVTAAHLADAVYPPSGPWSSHSVRPRWSPRAFRREEDERRRSTWPRSTPFSATASGRWKAANVAWACKLRGSPLSSSANLISRLFPRMWPRYQHAVSADSVAGFDHQLVEVVEHVLWRRHRTCTGSWARSAAGFPGSR